MCSYDRYLSYLGSYGSLPGLKFSRWGDGYAIIKDFVYFVLVSPRHQNTPKTSGVTLRQYLKTEKYNDTFINHFLLPALSGMCTCTYEALMVRSSQQNFYHIKRKEVGKIVG